MSETLKSPWTKEQVANLNAFQADEMHHPFTCGRDGCRETLRATPDGWVCPREGCGYTQDWAIPYMAQVRKDDPFTAFLRGRFGRVEIVPVGDVVVEPIAREAH